MALGVLDQDVSAQLCLKFPLIYQEGVQNILFGWKRILCWALNGILSATTIFYFCIFSLETQAFRGDGQVVAFEILGATLYTCVVCVVNAQMALAVNYFTYIQHLLIWGSILYWYVFLLAFGALDPLISTTAYKVLTEACAPSASFWLVTLLVSILSLLPYFIYAALQIEFFPLYHQRIELTKATGQLNDPEFCDLVRQRSITTQTVGFTARFGGLLHQNSMAR